MEEIQTDALRAAYPALASAIHRLGDVAGLPSDVADPTGLGLGEHAATYRQIVRLLTAALPRLWADGHP